MTYFTHFFVLIPLVPLMCGANDAMTPLNVKTGLWESTTTMAAGIPGISEEILAALPAQQRARIESARNAAETPRKFCMTAETLGKMAAFEDSATAGNTTCKRTLIHSSASEAVYHLECSNKQFKASGNFRLEAVDPEHVQMHEAFVSDFGRAKTLGKR